MEKSLKRSVEIIKDVIEFLNGLKLDKKYRKQREEMLVSLNVYLDSVKDYVKPSGKSESTSKDNDFEDPLDMYHELETTEDQEEYVDIGPVQSSPQIAIRKTSTQGSLDNLSTYADNTVEDADMYTDNINEHLPMYVDNVPEENAAEEDVYEENELEVQEEYIDTGPVQPLPQIAVRKGSAPELIEPTPCEKLRDASLADFLDLKKEKSLFHGAWQKRWCVLYNNILYMYESSKDKKQKDAFDVTGFVMEVRDDITKETKRKGKTFELRNRTINKVYEFCATDVENLNQWLKYFGEARNADPSQSRKLSVPGNSTAQSSPKTNKFNIGFASLGNIRNRVRSTTSLSTNQNASASDTGDVYMDNEVDAEVYVDTEDPDQTYEDSILPSEDQQQDTYIENVEEEDTYDEVETAMKLPPSRPTKSLPSITTSKLPAIPEPNHPEVSFSDSPPPLPERDVRPAPTSPMPPAQTFKLPSPMKGRSATGLPPVPVARDAIKESGTDAVNRLPPRPSTNYERRALPTTPSLIKEVKEAPMDKMSYISELKKTQNETFAFGSQFTKEDEKYKDVDTAELYQGMWDCQASESNELSFKRGQIVHVISKDYDNYGWWVAKRDDKYGLVPKEYLMEAYER